MARNATNRLLQKARKSKSDEFYTQLCDIESELKHYVSHFKDKVVYCNCDDYRTSNFVKYFCENFKSLGLKRLIASCYRDPDDTLLNNNNEKGFFIDIKQENEDINLENFTYFKGDGDFRGEESIELLKQADIVVTNPPFSLFREYITQLVDYNKKFLVIGNVNSITYKEIFKLIQDDKVWLGVHLGRGVSGFIVPEHYELYGTEARIDEYGNRIVSPNNCLWLTNLDILKRHKDIPLTKKYYGNESEYPLYDNFNGINVNKTKDIPSDYRGAIGVPITFLHKYNPEQFEIIKFRKGDDGKDLTINGKSPYFRILVRNKRLPV